ncbi:uncharacterized protein (DUF305 family) [Rhodococcus sp. OK611]|uniref:DUF305 domain-containing protein n=1 Tax=unclassified Rhodococcus (in: high G+C Gram-positive bacteria) TaxID=192944 RepID=UPI000BC68EA5|nr:MULTISPECIES: DUF305 domain-containing protein [unclassified Rhodococcus (in: high G+C Gram-positive bacteria)]PTR37449.1 uncharacterized protein (DUF305 family) [Rhodococcus sp. OK611]SNX93355.1 Uncharacterized conserved protein, DUF305 family [Rhodococcus sp. OK270]
MTDQTGADQNAVEQQAPEQARDGGKRSQRTALAVLGLIAAVAIGFAIGFLASLPLRDGGADNPGASSVDVGFAQDMTVHHNQAVEMSAIAIANATDPMVRDLAYDILTTQQNQIGQMTGWLSLWNQPLLPTGDYMTWMNSDESGHGGDGHGHAESGHDMGTMTSEAGAPASTGAMPGMASSEDMAALRQARGPAADVLYLQLMLRHHQGGLPMMEYGAQHAEVPTVQMLAQTMVDTQQSEADRITAMLQEKGAAPLPMN